MSDYATVVSELYDLQKFAIKLGLENIRALCAALQNPQERYPVIHVAGTNGKGSTSLYLAHILQAHGLKTGLFTSPHLTDFRERIRVNGRLIPEQDVMDFWKQVKPQVLQRKATFFDTTTAMALWYFARQQVDVTVMETGLGGRLDSTNIVPSRWAVITPVSFDHQKQLGHTLRDIAGEKAGIIKENAQVISAPQQAGALEVLKARAGSQKARWIYLSDAVRWQYSPGDGFHVEGPWGAVRGHLPQPGAMQVENFSLACLVAYNFLREHGLAWNGVALEERLSAMRWPGRLELVRRSPDIYFDVSHNAQGIARTVETFFSLVGKRKAHLILGLVNDKDMEAIVRLLVARFASVTVTEPESGRRQDGRLLADAFERQGQKAKLIKDSREAYEFVKKGIDQKDVLLVMGSHYLIGALKRTVDIYGLVK